MENDQHTHTNETNEPKKPVEIELTDAQLEHLYLDGSPEDAEVQEWLNAHGITPGERVIVKKEDGTEIIAETDENNFFVTNREASVEHSAERARSILALEDTIDEHSVELAEAEPRLTREEEEEIGEVALGATGVAEPYESSEMPAPSQQELYPDEIESLLNRAIGFLETEGQALDKVDQTVLSRIRENNLKLQRAFDSGNYPVAALRTLMKSTIDELYSVRGAIGRYSEGLVPESLQYVNQAEEAALSSPEGTRDGVGISSFKDDLLVASEAMEQFGRGDLVKTIAGLEDIIKLSYSRPINMDEIRNVLSYLKGAQEGSDLDVITSQAARSAKAIVDRFKALMPKN